jgi:hypothetical protein
MVMVECCCIIAMLLCQEFHVYTIWSLQHESACVHMGQNYKNIADM